MKHSFSRRKKIFLSVTAGVVLVVFLAGAAGAAYISGKMDLLSRPLAGQGGSSQSGTDPGDAVLSFDGMDLSGIDVMENGGSIAPPEGGVNINSGVINVLLIGSDERENSADGSARADSIMMLSVDSRKNTWKLVSFERGVGVSIPNRGDDWLTHTYAYGGANLLMKTLQEYFKVDVSRYVKIDFSLFETAITDIGGVVVDMSQAEADYMNGIAGEQKWTAGTARLDGPTALVYARMRKLDSDWERVERQREVVQAAADQVATLSLPKLDLIAN
ncbi:MAG: LCP family protein [Ruthenibacterium lactatiformans]